MAYRIIDVEATNAPDLALGPHETGAGVIVRRGGTPVAFFLLPCQPSSTLEAAVLRELVARRAAVDVVREGIRQRLIPPRPRLPLEITVAICTRDRPELLARCLSSLGSLATRVKGVSVLVIDNAPTSPATEVLVGGLPYARYVREPRPGLDVARNRALVETRTSHVAFLDDDVVVDERWLDGLEAAWSDEPGAGAVTGLVLPLELRSDAQIAFEARGGFRRGTVRRRFRSGSAHGTAHPLGAGAFGTGANMAFRTAVLRELGGFDEALDAGPALPGGGDLDIFARLLRAGHTLLYEPRATVYHQHRPDMAALRRQYWTWGTGFMAFLHKTARADRSMRPVVARIGLWWARDLVSRLRASMAPGSLVRPSHIAAELAGGIATAAWKYPLMRRRSQRSGSGTGIPK